LSAEQQVLRTIVWNHVTEMHRANKILKLNFAWNLGLCYAIPVPFSFFNT
jgi:nitroimidazol reductase NimA-like FMN-containing flavoprotein (pyridoxamine 5'-phosphate oxidase superfamily)